MQLSRPLRRTLTAPFGAIAAARHARAFHPQGFLCEGTWRVSRSVPVTTGVPLLDAGSEHRVLARPSRGIGLPETIGDLLAIAVRVVDAHGPGRPQDLLLNTSADVPVLHHLFLPAPRWFAQSYSSCLPYRTPGGVVLIGLLPPDARGPGPSLQEMRDAVTAGVRFGIAVAVPLGRWQRIGELELRGLVDPRRGDVDFEPFVNCGGGLEPAPSWLQSVRSEAYRWSRRGRGAPTSPRLEPGPTDNGGGSTDATTDGTSRVPHPHDLARTS